MANNTVTVEATTTETTVMETPDTDTQPTTVTEATPKVDGFADLQKQAKRDADIFGNLADTAQCLETNQHYADLGCFYAGKAPVANSFGAELGVVTRDEKTGTVQRTGIGFYIRSDHAADVKFNLCP
jgi:hypothetical protein